VDTGELEFSLPRYRATDESLSSRLGGMEVAGFEVAVFAESAVALGACVVGQGKYLADARWQSKHT